MKFAQIAHWFSLRIHILQKYIFFRIHKIFEYVVIKRKDDINFDYYL